MYRGRIDSNGWRRRPRPRPMQGQRTYASADWAKPTHLGANGGDGADEDGDG